jgi:hypothetical protein
MSKGITLALVNFLFFVAVGALIGVVGNLLASFVMWELIFLPVTIRVAAALGVVIWAAFMVDPGGFKKSLEEKNE